MHLCSSNTNGLGEGNTIGWLGYRGTPIGEGGNLFSELPFGFYKYYLPSNKNNKVWISKIIFIFALKLNYYICRRHCGPVSVGKWFKKPSMNKIQIRVAVRGLHRCESTLPPPKWVMLTGHSAWMKLSYKLLWGLNELT